MQRNSKTKQKTQFLNAYVKLFLFLVIAIAVATTAIFYFFPQIFSSSVSYMAGEVVVPFIKREEPKYPPLDTVLYDAKLLELANNLPMSGPAGSGTGIPASGGSQNVGTPVPLWPVKTTYPNGGAILPFKRVVAYYGNLYSTKMGVLGEYPEAEMLSRLKSEVSKWELADPATPVQPAFHYIAVVAQGSAGADGKYRLRMPHSEIDKVLKIAEKIGAIVFLDFQVGFSTLAEEIPMYEKYFKLPNVHLGIDPEFSMKHGIRPGKVVGTYDASDVNYAAEFLSKIVKENDLPPKILVVHRYTQKMLTGYKSIKPLPEVQIVIHMDGWGAKAKKIATYRQFVYPEPVQFTGFKLFYKNDLWDKGSTLFTPEELLKLSPRPIYIQYQ